MPPDAGPPAVRPSGILLAERRFILLTAGAALPAHAACHLLHEYSHSFAACLLGWKPNPFRLDFGPPTLANLLFQQDVDEDVDYDAIFSAHAAAAAALIAFAGPGIGNGLGYGIFFALFRRRVSRRPDAPAWFLFFLAVFFVGNVWSYAPTRTITTHGDMALLARGLHLDPWLLPPLVTIPALLLLLHALRVLFPLARDAFLRGSPVRLALASALVGHVLFGFFGGLDLSGRYGPVPALLSVLSVLVLLPSTVAWCICAAPSTMPDPSAPRPSTSNRAPPHPIRSPMP